MGDSRRHVLCADRVRGRRFVAASSSAFRSCTRGSCGEWTVRGGTHHGGSRGSLTTESQN
jgi:hypothetical protein